MEINQVNSSVGKIREVEKLKKQAEEKRQKEQKIVTKLMHELATTDIGRKWLKAVYELSGFGDIAEDINVNFLQRREAMRYFYVKAFRQFFNASTLKIVEGDIEDQDVEE